MDGSGFEFHIARAARDRYGFADRLFSLTANVVVVDLAASRDLAHRMDTVRDADRRPDHLVHPGALNAMGILDEVMHLVLAPFRERRAARHPGRRGHGLRAAEGHGSRFRRLPGQAD